MTAPTELSAAVVGALRLRRAERRRRRYLRQGPKLRQVLDRRQEVLVK
jgi:hypothetical protein